MIYIIKNWAVLFTFRCFNGIIWVIDKLKFDGTDYNENHKYDVRLCDLDLNNHMNNTKYPDTIFLEKPCSFCQIDYVHEAKLNDVLDIKIKKEEASSAGVRRIKAVIEW